MKEENNKRLGELIMELAGGNMYALAEIDSLMAKILMTIGNLYYHNRKDIEDAIQALYVLLFDKAKHFKGNINASVWIIKMFESLIKSRLRNKKSEDKFLQEEFTNFQSERNIFDDGYIDNHLFLKDIFDTLQGNEKKIVVYYYWCKCSIREVAELLHISKSAVSKKIRQLEEKVRTM